MFLPENHDFQVPLPFDEMRKAMSVANVLLQTQILQYH